jgi:hypothetical protein
LATAGACSGATDDEGVATAVGLEGLDRDQNQAWEGVAAEFAIRRRVATIP